MYTTPAHVVLGAAPGSVNILPLISPSWLGQMCWRARTAGDTLVHKAIHPMLSPGVRSLAHTLREGHASIKPSTVGSA
jgi:hypothetical protein